MIRALRLETDFTTKEKAIASEARVVDRCWNVETIKVSIVDTPVSEWSMQSNTLGPFHLWELVTVVKRSASTIGA